MLIFSLTLATSAR